MCIICISVYQMQLQYNKIWTFLNEATIRAQNVYYKKKIKHKYVLVPERYCTIILIKSISTQFKIFIYNNMECTLLINNFYWIYINKSKKKCCRKWTQYISRRMMRMVLFILCQCYPRAKSEHHFLSINSKISSWWNKYDTLMFIHFYFFFSSDFMISFVFMLFVVFYFLSLLYLYCPPTEKT